MILSLQGCMAVGKTTAVRYLQENATYININYEVNRDIVEEVKRRKLDKNVYEDYLEQNQLNNELTCKSEKLEQKNMGAMVRFNINNHGIFSHSVNIIHRISLYSVCCLRFSLFVRGQRKS